MLNSDTIKRMALQYRTTEINIVREYVQHLFLSFLYKEKKSENILFKGGTALRIVFQSPRFSEDLDFSGFGIDINIIETMLINIIDNIDKVGVNIEISESKKTSGGYIGAINLVFSGYKTQILLEISLRKKIKVKGEPVLIAGDFLPPYIVEILPRAELIEEKMKAVLSRAKARDYYDLYFLLRKGPISVEQRKYLREIYYRLRNNKISIEKELKDLLPADQQKIIRNFHTLLVQEISRYV